MLRWPDVVMWSLRHPVLILLLYKDVIGLLIQAGLLIASSALIWVGVRQAKGAKAQARAANRQVKAAQEQVKAAEAQAKSAAAQVAVAQQQVKLLKAQVEIAGVQSAEMQLQGYKAKQPVCQYSKFGRTTPRTKIARQFS